MSGRATIRAAIRAAVTASVFAAPAALFAQSLLPLEDYQVIINRKPFGDVGNPGSRNGKAADAEQAAQEAQAAKEQQALAKQLDLVAVNVNLSGKIVVGFIDKSVKPANSHYLVVGETEAGYTVESADCDAETATISKDGVRITMKLGSGIVSETNDASDAAPRVVESKAAESADKAPQRPATRILRRPGMPGGPGGYRRAKQAQREAENAAAAEEEAQRREDEVARLRRVSDSAAAKAEHDMNYKLLLEGKEPVSEIHLTPEEEQELVKLGRLPAGDSAAE